MYYEDLCKLKVYKNKSKTGTVDRVIDGSTIVAHNMFKKETNWDLFIGMEVQLIYSLYELHLVRSMYSCLIIILLRLFQIKEKRGK